jgi:predicted nucleic acid-binding protein
VLIYFDNCALQRPSDQQGQRRIQIESEAVLALLEHCRSGLSELVSSEVLFYEVENNPDLIRKAQTLAFLEMANIHQPLSDEVELRASEFVVLGLKRMDALNLASAEVAGAKFFCTCDDKLLRRSKLLTLSTLEVLSPIDLLEELQR